MLKRHAEYGCLSLVCHTAEDALPFIFFALRKRRGVIPLPAMQLGYCRSIPEYVRCAGAIGRYLLRRGNPVIIIDANGPMPGLPGIYSGARGRKYFGDRIGLASVIWPIRNSPSTACKEASGSQPDRAIHNAGVTIAIKRTISASVEEK